MCPAAPQAQSGWGPEPLRTASPASAGRPPSAPPCSRAARRRERTARGPRRDRPPRSPDPGRRPGHARAPPGPPLREHPRPLGIRRPRGAAPDSPRSRASGQHQRPDHSGGFDHSRVEMRSTRSDPRCGGRPDRARTRRGRPWGATTIRDSGGFARAGASAAPPGRGGPPTADLRTSCRAAASRRSPTDDGREAARRHVPRLGAAPVEHLDLAHARPGQHRGDRRARPGPLRAPGPASRAGPRAVRSPPPGVGWTTESDATSGRSRSRVSARRRKASASGPPASGSSSRPASVRRDTRMST